jgi:hypothetical protein
MLLDSKAIWRLFGGVKSWRKVGVTVYDQGTVQSLERIFKAINFAALDFVLRY